MKNMYPRLMVCFLALIFLISGIFIFSGGSSAEEAPMVFGDIDIDTRINNHYAVTRTSMEIRNDGNTSQEVQFNIDVPDNAMISNMSITINEITSYAQVKIKEEAQQDYDDAKKNGTTATKISGTSDPTFFRVALNIEAESSVTWTFTYEQLVLKELGIFRFELPLGTLSNLENFEDINVDIDLRTMENITDLSLDKGSIFPQENLLNERHRIITFYSSTFSSDDDIIIEYQEESPPINGTLETFIDGSGGYFMHVFSPQFEDLGSYLPKDIIFVLDRSGSMEGRKMEQMKDAFGEIVYQLQPDDRFNLITFATDVTSYDNELIPATTQNMDDAKTYIDQIDAYTSTNIDGALSDALSMFDQQSEALPIIVFLTDGNPTEGITHIPTIRQNVLNENIHGASIYSLGFGDDLDFEFLSALSLENNGYAVKIQETTDASSIMQGFYETISMPLLMDLYFDYSAGSFDVIPTYVPSLFEGSETVVVGRFDPTKERIVSTVTAQTSEGQRVFEESFEVLPNEEKDFIARLWAFRMIRNLQDQITVSGEMDQLKDGIIDLALEYSFITPYTSFILVIKDPQTAQTDDKKEGEWDVSGGTEGDTDGDGVADDSDPFPYDRNDLPGALGDDDDDDTDDDDYYPADEGDDSNIDIIPGLSGEDKNDSASFLLIVAVTVLVLIIILIVFGYSRIRRDQLLEQENRKKIYEKILDDPSIHFRGLQRAVDLEVGVLSHHLNVLEKEQLIVSEQDGNNRRFWGAGVKHDDNQVRLSRIQENILKSIEKEPGITQSQIAKRIGVSRKVVFYHVKFLSKAGVVREEKEKRNTHYYTRE